VALSAVGQRQVVFNIAAEHSPAQLLSGYGAPNWHGNVAIVAL
jgi:hypothetical protein